MLFRSATLLLLSAFGAAAASSSEVSFLRRDLQVASEGIYEIRPPVVNYNPTLVYTDTSTTPSVTSVIPSIVVVFERDDVENSFNGAAGPYGFVEVTHYTAGCGTLIDNGFVSAVGEQVQAAFPVPTPLAVDTANPKVLLATAPSNVGLTTDYTFQLTNAPSGTTPATTNNYNGVLTVIRYPIAVLTAAATGITTALGDDRTTQWCTRIDLKNNQGVSQGFRTVDITLEYNVNNAASITLLTTEDTEGGEVEPTVGDFTVNMFFATAPTTPTGQLNTPLTALPAPLEQGQQFTIGLAPQSNLGSLANAVDMDIISVESCIFWLDTFAAGGSNLPDPTELVTEVIRNNVADPNTISLFRCDSTIIADNAGATAGETVDGCGFTVNLPSTFFITESTATTTVRGRCVVTLEFQGDTTPNRRRTQVVDINPGDTFPISSATSFLVKNTAAVEPSCTAGCFILFCWIQWIICFFQGLFN